MPTTLRKPIIAFAIVASIAAPVAASDAHPRAEFVLSVIHSNDGESRLIDAGGSQAQYGGVARFATVVRSLRAQSTDCRSNRGAVLISSGDNFLAGAQFNASLGLPPDRPFYDAVALDLLDYTASAVGNHEFDFGPDVTARFIGGFSSRTPFVSANLDVSLEPALDRLARQRRIVGSVVAQVCGQRVGIVGATTPLLPAISSPRSVRVDPDLVGTIQFEIEKLRSRGVGIVILTSHLQSVSEDLSLIPKLRGVDIAISGGGSDLLNAPAPFSKPLVPGDNALASVTFTSPGGQPVTLAGPTYPIVIAGADGRPVRVITTDGNYKYAGRLVATFDREGEISDIDLAQSGPYRVSGNSLDADAVAPAPDVQSAVVDPVAASVAALAANVIAASQVPLDARTANLRTRETNLGNLMADALLMRATALAPAFGAPVPNVAIQNSGGIRGNTLYLPAAAPAVPASFTELNTFDIAAFANFVSIVPNVPRAQFKEILENAVSRFPTADGRFPQVAGMCIVFDPTGTAQVTQNDGTVTLPGTRVREVRLVDGTTVVAGGTVQAGPGVNLVTNDFSARGGDQYPFRGLPFVTLGKTYQQTLFDYVTINLSGIITSAQYQGAADVASGTPTGGAPALRIRRVTNPAVPPTCP
jgi:2',3'-cyclic-nucleotide 2'-phosphodiesterase (5'-nucleotidase family)